MSARILQFAVLATLGACREPRLVEPDEGTDDPVVEDISLDRGGACRASGSIPAKFGSVPFTRTYEYRNGRLERATTEFEGPNLPHSWTEEWRIDLQQGSEHSRALHVDDEEPTFRSTRGDLLTCDFIEDKADETWVGGSYRGDGLGVDAALRCFTTRWETRRAGPGASVLYSLDALGPTGLMPPVLEPGVRCLMHYPAEGQDLCVAHADPLHTFEEVEGLRDEFLAEIESFRSKQAERVPRHEFELRRGPRGELTRVASGEQVLLEVEWGDAGLPILARLAECEREVAWSYELDERGRVVVEIRRDWRGEQRWDIEWGSRHPKHLRMREQGVGELALEVDERGRATRAHLDGQLLMAWSYDCDIGEVDGSWARALLELAVVPIPIIPANWESPVHRFTAPQFVYSGIDNAIPLVIPELWGSGRGPIADIDIHGRFAGISCNEEPLVVTRPGDGGVDTA